MDAETGKVFDAAWQVVNWNYHEGGIDELRGELRTVLQAHAKAHPPELPKKVGENVPDNEGPPDSPMGTYGADAQTQAVFDAAQSIAATEDVFGFLKGDGVGFVIGRKQHAALKLALGVHAKTRPPELPKKAGNTCDKCGEAGAEVAWPDRLKGETLILPGENRPEPDIMVGDPFKPDITCSKCGAAMHPGDDGCLVDCRCTSKPKVASESRPEPEASRTCTICGTPLFHGGDRCLINSRCGRRPKSKPTVDADPGPPPPPSEAEYREWKKNGPDDGKRVVDQATFDLVVNAQEFVEWGANPKQCEDYLNRFELLRLSVGQFGRVCPPPPGSPLPPSESRSGVVFADLDPIVPGLQPMFAEFKAGDTCVLTYPRKLSGPEIDAIRKRWKERVPGVQVIIEDSGPTISFLRPAKGGDDAKK